MKSTENNLNQTFFKGLSLDDEIVYCLAGSHHRFEELLGERKGVVVTLVDTAMGIGVVDSETGEYLAITIDDDPDYESEYVRRPQIH